MTTYFVAHHFNTAMEYIVFWSYDTITILLLCPQTESAEYTMVGFYFNYHSSLRLFRKGHTWLVSLEELDESVNTPEPLVSVGMLWDDVRDSLREHKKRHECFVSIKLYNLF